MAVALLAGCGGGPPAAEVAAPTPGVDVRSFCAHLDAILPSRVDDRRMVKTIPSSPNAAAWGDPPVVLRCGVEPPAGLQPTSEVTEVDRVDWFLDETATAFVFTTVGRTANVEVAVPSSVRREDATAPLVDLAPAVKAADPKL